MHSLTIGITYYNEKELLTECLNSLAVQTMLPDEVLIYDDCATFPATEYIPTNFPLPIKIFRNPENKKPAFGRNLLIQEAQSIYIHFQDADDLFKPTCIASLKAKITETEADFIVNDIESQKNGELVAKYVMEVGNIVKGGFVNYGILGSYLVPSITYKRSLALNLGGFKDATILPQSEDYEFHIRLAHYAKNHAIIEQALVIQCLRNNSHSSTNQKQVYTSALAALKLLLKELPTQYHETIAQRAASIGTTLYGMGHKTEAKTAWDFAKKYGQNLFRYRHPVFKFFANIVGIENMELISKHYREIKKKYR
jgi:glycosyltransferase involved in cell wall biosynthesis